MDDQPTDHRPSGRPTRTAVDSAGVRQQYSRFHQRYGLDARARRAVHMAALFEAATPTLRLAAGTPDEEAARELRELAEAAKSLLAGGVVGRTHMSLAEYVAYVSLAPLVACNWSVSEAAKEVIRRDAIGYAPSTMCTYYHRAVAKIGADAA